MQCNDVASLSLLQFQFADKYPRRISFFDVRQLICNFFYQPWTNENLHLCGEIQINQLSFHIKRCSCAQRSLANDKVTMKFPGSEENRRLVRLLEDTLAREMRLWKAPILKSSRIQGTDIPPSQYQEVIFWLREMNEVLTFCPETFALGVCVLNRLLATVKAQSKYLKCIAITSLILAAKINEEDEVIASVKGLLAQSGCNFSTAEILRMERIILDKLHWDLYTATPIDFIHIFHALLVSGHPHLPYAGSQKRPCFQAALWTRQVQHCMACHQLWQCKGSTLALAIITLELERLTPDWFSVFTDLLKKAQIESMEFIRCKETVDEYLTSLELSLPTNAVYIFDPTNVTKYRAKDLEQEGEAGWRCGDQPGQRNGGGGERGEKEADEYYDGFRCLYNEGMGMEMGNGDMGCLNISPCPPLQPPLS